MSNNEIHTTNLIDLKEIDKQFDILRALVKEKIQLQQDLAFHKSLVNSPEVIIYINDIIKKEKVWSNENFEPLTGYTHKEARDMGEKFFHTVYHEEDRKIFEKSIDLIKCDHKNIQYAGIYRIYTKFYELRWFYTVGNIFKYTSHNEPWLLLGAGFDITEKIKQGEECLEQLMQENLELKFKGIKELLSKREREILKRIARGQCSNEIAEELFLSYHTVETHRKRILKKLEMKSTAELIKVACKSGLI